MNEPERLHGDDADRAQHYEEAERDAGIYAATHRPRETPLYIDGARCCLGCEERLDKKRLRALPEAVRCLSCQDRHESRRRLARATQREHRGG